MFRILTFLIHFLALLPAARAQSNLDYYLPGPVTYNKNIPTPASVLGYEVGEWHVTHDQLLTYMRAVDAASDRITISEYGRTHENRPLLLLTITSPANHGNIEQIKTEHRKLTDPQVSGKLDISQMPAVLWMGYSVHGNEPSGTNASLIATYYLAAAQGPEIDKILQNTIILLDPSINPDGMTRFASWVNSRRSKNLVSDPNSIEFNEVWPGGRFNHYWFDLNRDWLPLQHPESKGRLAKFHEWKPNVLTDHHEMGSNSTFFFQPGVPSRKHPLTPESNYQLTKKIGTYHAKALDKIGSLYFTEESYDDFYYGKGSTYPDVHGAIGILFEQASSRGHAQETQNGVLTFPFTIRNQVTTTLSSIAAVQDLRVDLLKHQRDFYKNAAGEATKQPVRAYVFGAEKDPARAYHLAEIIKQHQISIYRPKSTITANGKTFTPENAFLVPTDQPQFGLIQAMFEVRTKFQDSLFYDISAWTLPYAFNLDFAPLSKSFSNSQLGQKLEAISFPKGQVTGGPSDYAYAFEWHGYYAPSLLNTLLEKGITAKVATQPFYIDNGKKMDYGTILIPVGLQKMPKTELYALLQESAAKNGIEIFALTTGLTTKGLNLGSANFLPVRKPEIMMLAGNRVAPNDVGEAWHLLDNRLNIKTSLVSPDALDRISLDRYTVIIMMDGTYSDIGQAGQEKLKAWVQRGNTILGVAGAARWLAAVGISGTKFKTNATPEGNISAKPYVDMANNTGAQFITGAIFNATLDLTHPLAYGYTNPNIYLFRDNNIFMERSRSPYSNPLMYTGSPLASGYISKVNEQKLRSTAAADITGLGAGRVISLTDNPNFRAFWYGTNKIFLNSIFFGQLMRTSAGTSE